MFSLLKLIIWIAGIITVSYFVLGYFGYEINSDYFTQSKEACEQRLKDCGKDLVRQGTDNVHCDFNCANPNILIKKK